jgi:hypothetical protein
MIRVPQKEIAELGRPAGLCDCLAVDRWRCGGCGADLRYFWLSM